jgi:CubicO group peptidase (beta-lactamase class C family)
VPSLARPSYTIQRILTEPLQFAPGQGCLYSDLGFMTLAFIIEADAGTGLARYSREQIFGPLNLADDLMFRPRCQETRIALTRPNEEPGLVNDLNARALGGIAGHAGLFGTAHGVAKLAAEILSSLTTGHGFFDRDTTTTFCTRTGPRNATTRALGFDTPSIEGSSAGHHFSSRSVGHTGFTGTSLWIDPETDLIVVLLTNRVFMGESDFRIAAFRPRLHDTIMAEIEGT